jgi:hypothetical protein
MFLVFLAFLGGSMGLALWWRLGFWMGIEGFIMRCFLWFWKCLFMLFGG